MVPVQRILVVTVVACALGSGAVSSGQDLTGRQSADHSAAVGVGRLAGAVTDADGRPLDGAMVSAFGPSGAELAVSGRDGHFLFQSVVPGPYFVQAHLVGFVTSRRELVAVSVGSQVVHSIALSPVANSAEASPVRASFGLPRARDEESNIQERPREPGTEPAGVLTPHDHTEKAWRLRRARRSVLKQAEAWVAGVDPIDGHAPAVPTATLAHAASGLGALASGLGAFPLTGQVNLLTRGTLERLTPASVLSGSARPSGIANVTVGAPGWNGDWAAQGAMTTGDVMSWFASGSFLADADAQHRVGFDVTYGRQRYEGGNPAALAMAAGSRYAASFGASDRWHVSPHLALDYGGRYSTYGYIEEDGLFSPRAAFTVTPRRGTRVRIGGAQETIAPGAEEFLPPTEGMGLWLPPERTFAAFSRYGGLHPERTRNLEIGVEHDLGANFSVGVRRFYQDVTDQMATLFGADELGNAPTGHYYIARAGSVTSRGWIVTLRRKLGGRVSGSVDYSVAEARWVQAGVDTALRVEAPGVLRPEVERFHDASGTLEAVIPGSSTRVLVRCRVNGAYARADLEDPVGLEARFDVLIQQALPFSPIDGSRWEALLAFRSLFFDPKDMASMFNELLVVRPPKQVVGGVVVHF